MDLGYLGILGAFIGMIALCFFWGAWEWKKPEDPGPLFIDLERTIRKKIRKHEFRLSRTHAYETPTELMPASVQSDSGGLSQTFSSNETIRVRGDLRIAKGELIPYNMIVEGNLTSQEDVIFQGGLHIKGRAIIGARNRIEKSIVCQKELILFEDVIVYNCIDCDGLVFIKHGVKVGVGQEGGGIASAKTVYLENAEGPLEIHSKDRIRIVGALMEVVPDELREIIEVKAT
jgi:hypothetical protein